MYEQQNFVRNYGWLNSPVEWPCRPKERAEAQVISPELLSHHVWVALHYGLLAPVELLVAEKQDEKNNNKSIFIRLIKLNIPLSCTIWCAPADSKKSPIYY